MSVEDQHPGLQPILRRIPEEWGRNIDVGPGWYPVLFDLDQRLAAIDPDYVIKQVKEEGGEFDFRFDTAHTDRYQPMRAIVRNAELKASHVCEECGRTGVLHVSREGAVRRLCAECAAAAQEGYETVSSDLETRAALYRVAQQAAQLHRTLSALPPDANKRITGGDLDAVSQLASRMLWASTADLHEQGRHAYAQQVVERAAELAAEEDAP
ncbi:hypothetical protein [Tsukamurella paurometabola]|uniref:Uncharacterized protein n=1 Tax=Tsukamurella paurometabola TaxID=2061 RepID=A0ABS5NJ11_TSUPA|nr:hypothetical protein [Tsukamurella paurometabola]MBS4104276.1 hypothetical protein [Tsukamurella paurometabola]